MPRQFHAAKPLQAGKFAVVLGTLVFGVLGTFHVIPDLQLTVLLLVPVVSFCLALLVSLETLVAGYRAARADDPPTARLTARPAYTVVRLIEAGVAITAAGGIVVILVTLPDEPMPGPGAIGLLFVFVALGLLVLLASLVRTLTEYYYHRRDRAGDGLTSASPN